MVTEAQLRHIEAHQAEFDETYGDGETRNVREYFLHEYAHEPDTYLYVCSDLGIEPLPDRNALRAVERAVSRMAESGEPVTLEVSLKEGRR